MPKEVDHPARRRELADAACRVIARNGLAGTTLADVAEESGWSIGSIRYYFPNKDELGASALWRAGGRGAEGGPGGGRRGHDDERPADRRHGTASAGRRPARDVPGLPGLPGAGGGRARSG